MAKRKRVIDYEIKMEQEGRGKGEGKDYKPLYNNQDVSPKGRTTRTKDENNGRQALALNDKELKIRKVVEFSGKIKDIKEIYPIDITETQLIASCLGIKHPVEKGKGQLRPLIISLLLTSEDDEQTTAIQYTSANSLTNIAIINELEIVRTWCRKNRYKFMIITDELLKSTAIENINMLHDYLRLENLGLEGIDIDEVILIEKWILEKITEYSETIRRLCMNCAKSLDIKTEYVLSIYRHLVANRVIEFNLNQPWDVGKLIQPKININRFKKLIGRYRVNDNTERYL